MRRGQRSPRRLPVAGRTNTPDHMAQDQLKAASEFKYGGVRIGATLRRHASAQSVTSELSASHSGSLTACASAMGAESHDRVSGAKKMNGREHMNWDRIVARLRRPCSDPFR